MINMRKIKTKVTNYIWMAEEIIRLRDKMESLLSRTTSFGPVGLIQRGLYKTYETRLKYLTKRMDTDYYIVQQQLTELNLEITGNHSLLM